MTTDWNFVIDTIKRNKCVLFVGPQIYTGSDGTTLEEALCRVLDARNPDNPYIRSHYNDGFLLFRENKFRSRVISQIRQFYSQPFPHAKEVFEKISEIPFPIIVTLTPDRLLSSVMKEKGVAHQCDFYHFGQPARHQEAPLGEVPMVYNLLGWVEEDESLVLTHNDLFGYLEAVFQGGKMNADLKAELLQASNYIFLGLAYDKWYMQLLLRVLSLHVDGARFERISPKPALTRRTRSMYEDQFKIQFVEENIEFFVNELYQRCEKENLLRKVDATPEASAPADTINLDTVVDLVAYAKTREALEALRNYLLPLRNRNARQGGFFTDLVLLMNRFEELEKKTQRGLTYAQEDLVERAKINFDLLTLINHVRDTGGQGMAATGTPG